MKDRLKKRRGPSPVAVTAVMFAALFAAMIIYMCRYAYTNRQVMMSNSYNGRQTILQEQDVRGSILARNGEVLAETQTDEEGNETRVYPYSNVFSHVVGYSSKGRSGIEAQQNYYLIRSDIPLNEKAKLAEEGIKYPGDTVRTTLDVDLQNVAYNALSAYTGAIVAMDVKTGAVLAMVSKPDFDPNKIDEIWSSVVEDKEDTRLLNRATQGLYPPGSTFKIVTALQYIRENSGNTADYHYNCSGSYTNGDLTIHCFHGENHGSVDFYTSFQKSCNSSFANIGMTLNRASFGRTLDDLGFGKDLSLEFATAKSSAVMGADAGDEDVMQLSIGQGATAMSPLHLCMITQAAANGGVMLKPYIVSSVDGADGKNMVLNEGGNEVGRVMSEEEAGILREMMVMVVNGGTGRRLSGLSYQAAGKTGSAEFNSTKKEESHAWFTGFAPAEDPQIAVTVIIEEAGSGGEYAVPMAKRVFDQYFGVE